MARRDFVLRAPRIATSNASTTGEALNGVVRDVKQGAASSDLQSGASLYDVAADQYRSAFLENPDSNQEEYLVWAANSSNLAVVEDPSWGLVGGQDDVRVPSGFITVEDPGSDLLSGGVPVRTDGTTSFVFREPGARSVAGISSVTVRRGSDKQDFTFTEGVDVLAFDPESGVIIVLDTALTRTALPVFGSDVPALSLRRGDRVVRVDYYLASAKFWWTKNDGSRERFGWSDKLQRWEPFKGGAPINLGTLLPDLLYTMDPPPQGFDVGAYLPGSTDADAYSMIRIGDSPNSSSLPVSFDPGAGTSPSGVLVVSNDAAQNPYTFSAISPPPAAVIGVTSGLLQWNPSFVFQNAGGLVWYIFQEFDARLNGELGLLINAKESPFFLCPVPSVTEHPFIRFGSRKPVTVVAVESDALLSSTLVISGSVAFSLSTGLLKFNEDDLNASDPEHAGFDRRFLNVAVLYDGVALNQKPQPVRPATPLVDVSGSPAVVTSVASQGLYIPDSSSLLGLGLSGVMHLPDGTGATPSIPSDPNVIPGTRAGGENQGDAATGLIRSLGGEFASPILFSKKGAYGELIQSRDESAFPFPFKVTEKTAHVALIRSSSSDPGSRVLIGSVDRSRDLGEQLYFLNPTFTPSTYSDLARIISRQGELFSFEGSELLEFAIDGQVYQWLATDLGTRFPSLPLPGVFSALQVAESLDDVITGSGLVKALGGRLVIEAGDTGNGSVEIGFGAPRDLSGCSALGFLPGWKVDTSLPETWWLPDSGISFGLARSPEGSEDTPDFKAYGRVDDLVISSSIGSLQYQFLDILPLRDIGGYDDDVFFSVVKGINRTYLRNYDDVVYQLNKGRFAWGRKKQEVVSLRSRTDSIQLAGQGIFEEALYPSVNGNNFSLSEAGGPFVTQELNKDYTLQLEGQTGALTLSSEAGGLFLPGGQGSFSQGSTLFSDPSKNFISSGVQASFHLKILSTEAKGSYIIKGVTSAQLVVSPQFPVSSLGEPVSWEILEGVPDAQIDEGLLADVVYSPFNHLKEEPFKIRLLSSTGVVPVDSVAQDTQRLRALLTEALNADRFITIRFGLTLSQGNTASLLALSKIVIGGISNDSLFVPDVGSLRFLAENFSIQVGGGLFDHGAGLDSVALFSSPVPSGNIEYLATTGELRFADDLLLSYSSAVVRYTERFLDPAQVPAGIVEYEASTGLLNISTLDMSEYGGNVDAYLVEQMTTENRKDVAISPFVGSVAFVKPLRSGQIVEAEYFKATGAGEKELSEDGQAIEIIEQLPRFIQREVATRISARKYSFNPTGRTITLATEPVVYVGQVRMNFGVKVTTKVRIEDAEIIFAKDVDLLTPVVINYSVFESFGGETGFDTSEKPIYRPSFFLNAAEDKFYLESDRTGDIEPGRSLLLGPQSFYIKSSSYDAGEDLTEVTIFPTPGLEVGSRAPGQDAESFLTSRPIGTLVGGVSVPSAPAGFWTTLVAAYHPIQKGQRAVLFVSASIPYAAPGHLFEVDGDPYVILSVSPGEVKGTISLEMTTPFRKEYGSASIKISVRAVLREGERHIPGSGRPVLTDHPIEAVIFGIQDDQGQELPGRSLVIGDEFKLTPSDGSIDLLEPNISGIAAGWKIYLRHTGVRSLSPTIENGAVIYPRYLARYIHEDSPANNPLIGGGVLQASYSFSNPDTFYSRVVPLDEFLSEVTSLAAAQSLSQNRLSGGAGSIFGFSRNNWDRGQLSRGSSLRAAMDTDRGARELMLEYSDLISPLEQVSEVITGLGIGERDGRFRFFIGKGKQFAPRGYENELTGDLNERDLWAQQFLSITANAGAPIWTNASDFLVYPEPPPGGNPSQAPSLLNGVLFGTLPDTESLRGLAFDQRNIVGNDLDDVVAVGREKKLTLVSLGGIPARVNFGAKGAFKQMNFPSLLSRIYPTRGVAAFFSVPGLKADLLVNDVGFYSRNRINPDTGREISTFGTVIGSLSNPVTGEFTNPRKVVLRKRYPRAWIVSYSSTGFENYEPLTAGKPSLIVSAVPLGEFPINAQTGLPDESQLISQGGEISDVVSGDVGLAVPAFVEGGTQQLYLGRPDRTVQRLGFAPNKLVVGGSETYQGIFVAKIYRSCILTFSFEKNGAEITSPFDILEATGDWLTSPVTWGPETGDTIFASATVSEDFQPNDPPSLADLEKVAGSLPSYRIGTDVGLNADNGDLIDMTLPTAADGSSIDYQLLAGQNPVPPVQALEADLRYSQPSLTPLRLPALLGETKNDQGLYSLPRQHFGCSEATALRGIANRGLFEVLTDSPEPGAVYPGELLSNDGEVIAATSPQGPPAALITALDAKPVTTAGSYVAGSGDADLEPFDVLLTEVDDLSGDLPASAQGILSVGRVNFDGTKSTIEPPRFVSPSRKGDRIRYILNNAMVAVHPQGGSPVGMKVSESGGQTIFDDTSLSTVFFNDGSVASTGGLNNIFDPGGALAWPNDNVVEIRLFDVVSGALVETITLQGASAVGAGGTVVLASAPVAADHLFTIDQTGFVSPATLAGGPFDFAISINTATGPVVTGQNGTFTGLIEGDRLTFSEDIDLRFAGERGLQTAASVSIEASLEVWSVSGSAGGSPSEGITINQAGNVNGGSGFTFLLRESSEVGEFAGGTGSLRVMGFEGFGNSPILTTPETAFSGIPGSDFSGVGPILSGAGQAFENRVVVNATPDNPNVLGSVGSVIKGDLLVIDQASDGAGSFATAKASSKVGSYLVRQSVAPDNQASPTGHDRRSVRAQAIAGQPLDWARIKFPSLVAFDQGAATLEVDLIETLDLSQVDLATSPGTGPHYNFLPTGRVYVIVNAADLNSGDPNIYKGALVSAAYTGIDGLNDKFTGLSGFMDALGASITSGDFLAAVIAGAQVSGASRFGVSLAQRGGLPDAPTVGIHDLDTANDQSVRGFQRVTLRSPLFTAPTSLLFQADDPLPLSNGGNASTLGDLSTASVAKVGINIAQLAKQAPTSFVSDEALAVYDDIAGLLSLDLDGAQWASLHNPNGHTLTDSAGISCLIPGEELTTESGVGGAAAFFAQAGIFLEPSWPLSCLDLGAGSAKIVDASHSLTLTEVGFRSSTTRDWVKFSVRRLRRFSGVEGQMSTDFQCLKALYETRRGMVTSYTSDDQQFGVLTANEGTQIGLFDLPLNNINAGDTVRLLNSDGDLVDDAEIMFVGSTILKLAVPGFTKPVSPGDKFEIYLAQPMVPHEQSWEQLFSAITDKVIFSSVADYGTNEGGYVDATGTYDDSVNRLRDTAIGGLVSFETLGVEVGDLVIVDPAGPLPVAGGPTLPEIGERPFGDISVSTRGVIHVPGSPQPIDDNRGFYRVTEVSADVLRVSGASSFAGDFESTDVVFSEGSGRDYAVYPTVTGSHLTGPDPLSNPPAEPSVSAAPGKEGQMDLRPTEFAVGGIFGGSYYSAAPFSYRIIRPTSVLSSEAVDLILMSRERIKAWIERISLVSFSSTYYQFQNEEHASALGILGPLSNTAVADFSGQVDTTPFANDSDCLSILDRRFWIGDFELDREPSGGAKYTDFVAGEGRPVLPDYLDLILDQRDRLRRSRLAWLDFRANRVNGTLEQIERNKPAES